MTVQPATSDNHNENDEWPRRVDPWPSAEQDLSLQLGLETHAFTARQFESSAQHLHEARGFVTQTLRDWDLARISGDASAIASELLANAFAHGLHPAQRADKIWLGLVRLSMGIVCSVADFRPDRPPTLVPQNLRSEEGWGLLIVDRLSEAWGWRPDGAVKMVWARISTQP
ncbi:ATP-binding protein [Streptomyces carpaticus]|uniref:ATP-binding protein n=1 Tax=Streptomyces carpaticus TaxID=285558 RepID=UPI003D2F7E71